MAWRAKMPVILVVAVVTVLIGAFLPGLSSWVRAMGAGGVCGWLAWTGEKDAPTSRRLSVALAWSAASLVASLILDRMF
jgi:hypothetical protein